MGNNVFNKSANIKVRICLADNYMKMYQLANILGMASTTFSKRMTKEMPDDVQRMLCELIEGNHQNLEKVKGYFDRTYWNNKPIVEHNKKVIACLKKHDMYKWQFADILHIKPETLSRWLRYERPEKIQDLLCQVIQGNTQYIGEIKNYFSKKVMSEVEQLQNHYADRVAKEVSALELEREIEMDQEREIWLYEKGRKNEYY